MNRYFYVPVMESCILHDGVALSDHLKMIDSELYMRERKFLEICDEPVYSVDKQLKFMNSSRQNRKTDQLFKERSLPRFVVIVYNDNRFYELASEVEIDPIVFGNIKDYEVLGIDIIDVFTDNPNYTTFARSFFEQYKQEKNKVNNKEQQKVLRKGFFFKR